MREKLVTIEQKVYGVLNYSFLTQKKFLFFFTNPHSVFVKTDFEEERYASTTLEFDEAFREFLSELSRIELLEAKRIISYGELWANMRGKYMGGKPYVQIEEMIAGGRLEQFTADEVVAAIYFCLIYKVRFCEPYFIYCCEKGIIGKLLLRLKQLEDENN